MAERNLSVRLSVIDGGKVKAELKDVGESGERSLKRIEDAASPASRGLQALDGAAGQVRGSLEGLNGRLGPLGAALSRLGPIGLAAGAALAGIGVVLTRGVQEAAEADRSYRRLEAVLRATGNASGLTAHQIADFAEGLEHSTLASAEAVKDAAAVLATFRSVSGDTFTRALSLAQDLSTVFGQDLSSSATQLGKALENPIEGISALRRVGVSFTASQKELIASLVETGQTAEAQKVILDALQQQVGGAGAAEAGGLTGAANHLSDAWGDLLKAIGRTPAVSNLAEGSLTILARGLENITRLFAEKPIAEQIVAANRKLIAAQDELAKLQSSLGGDQGSGAQRQLESARSEVARLNAEVNALIARARSEAGAFASEQRQAEAGRRQAEAERLTEELATQRRAIDRAVDQLMTDPADRIAKINRELEETKKKLQGLRAPDGSNASDVAAAIARAEDLARRQIAAIQRPLHEAAERVAAANTKVIDDLSNQIVAFADERQAFIDQALSRLSDGATAAQRAEVERLAGALYDEKQAHEDLAKTTHDENRVREEGRRLVESLRTPAEEYAATLDRLNGLLLAGAIDQETFNRALVKANDDLSAAQELVLRQSRLWEDGVHRALKDYVDTATNAAGAAEEATTRAFRTMEDSLVSFVTTGKLDFSSFAESIMADITRIAVRQAILKPLADWLGGGGGGDVLGGAGDFLAGLFHEGGVVGRDTVPMRVIDPGSLASAPRYHDGGIAGLRADELPAILKRGEAVLTPHQMAMLGTGLKNRDDRHPPINVVMNITTPDSNGFRYAQGQIAAEAARAIDRARRNL